MRIAVVTGAARGIGFAIAQALLRDGLRVVGVDLERAAIVGAADRLAEQGLTAFTPEVADVADADAVGALFERIAAAVGAIDALVNNAGICIMSDLLELTPEELRRQMAVNFESALFCCQRAIPLMLQRPGVKKIVNISSNGAYNFNLFDPVAYRSSKAALDTMTKHLARRYARDKIAVNSIAPAMTRTDLFDVVPPDVLERALAEMPHGDAMQPDQIAAWVAFLISPAGDCASGNVIILNQGRDVR